MLCAHARAERERRSNIITRIDAHFLGTIKWRVYESEYEYSRRRTRSRPAVLDVSPGDGELLHVARVAGAEHELELNTPVRQHLLLVHHREVGVARVRGLEKFHARLDRVLELGVLWRGKIDIIPRLWGW